MTALRAVLLLSLSFATGCEGCMRRRPAAQVDLGAWPACASAPADEVLVARELVSGPDMLEKGVVERYDVARHGDCYVGRVFLSWRLGETALEAVFDRRFVPIAAYKRMGYPGEGDLYEERGYRMSEDGTVMVRAASGEVERFVLRGPRPTVLVPTGRGLFSLAFQRALELELGESRRETAVDLRRLVERIEPASVRRDPIREEWRERGIDGAFTFMGRDTLFVDEEGFVLGDLAGLRERESSVEDVFEGLSVPFDASEAWPALREAGDRRSAD